jgi:hypothetical protein
MKSKIIIWLTLLTGLIGYTQPIIKWEKCIGGTNSEGGLNIFLEEDKLKVFVTSSSYDGAYIGNKGGMDPWIFTLDLQGNILRSKNYGGSGKDALLAVNNDMSDYYLMGGTSFSTDGDFKVDSNSSAIFLAQVDKNDSLLMNYTLPLSQYHQLSDIVQMNNGKFMIAGRVSQQYTACFGDSTYTNAIFLKAVDRQGNELWKRCLPGQGGASKIHKMNENRFAFLVGNSSGIFPFSGAPSVYVLFVDSFGNDLGNFRYSCGDSCGMGINTFRKLTDTSFALFSNVLGIPGGGDVLIINNPVETDIWFAIVDKNGKIIHQHTFPGVWDEVANDMIVTSEGDVILLATTLSNQLPYPQSNGYLDIWVIKLNNKGEMIWQKNLGGSVEERAARAIEVSSGLYAITGSTTSNDKDVKSPTFANVNAADAWVIMLEDTAITNQLTSIANMDFDFKIFPNPTNSMLTIQTDAAWQDATATLTNLDGSVVFSQALTNTQQQSLDIGHLPNGMYFVTVQSAAAEVGEASGEG